jgi:hypothetical protein
LTTKMRGYKKRDPKAACRILGDWSFVEARRKM